MEIVKVISIILVGLLILSPLVGIGLSISNSSDKRVEYRRDRRRRNREIDDRMSSIRERHERVMRKLRKVKKRKLI